MMTLNNTVADLAAGDSTELRSLFEAITDLCIDDTHCHIVTDEDATTTKDGFLERISLSAFPLRRYHHLPPDEYRRWQSGDEKTRAVLDREYGIEAKRKEAIYHAGESVFIKFLIKEMAQFLDCRPCFEEVIEARNARGQDYWKYVNDLYRDAKYENVMVDTGYAEGRGKKGISEFEAAILPAKARRLYRMETIEYELFGEDINFDDLVVRFLSMVRSGLDGTGNYGKKSYGMKSYLLPDIGVIKPLHDPEPARRSWEELKSSASDDIDDRELRAQQGKDLRRFLLTLALEECLERDMPMQVHTGDGEPPHVILRNQDPFYLEEIVRFDKGGEMQLPKIIPLHAGYPSVGKAAWLSHLYTNCYFELSIMTPLVHQSLVHRYTQILEVVPLSKILFGSDGFHLPELHWIAGIWGKRYLAQALVAHVKGGSLSIEEALEGARMILHKNNRRLYKIEPE